MKKRWFLLIVILAMLFAAGCQANVPQPTEVATTEASQAAVNSGISVLLTGVNNESKTLTLDQIKQMPSVQGQAGMKSSTGQITPPVNFKGVLLQDLVNEVGGIDDTMGVQVEAKDGYFITFSYDQIMNGSFVTYDPGTGDENKAEGPLQVMIAYEREGQPIPEDTDGALRLVIFGPKNDEVTDGHWAVKWVNKITIKSLASEWTVHLEGKLVEDMDRATFESGAAPNCHKTVWTDEKAQEWVGIPLWLMVGRVDDDKKHETGAYNEELAKQGYQIDVVAKDGYTVSFDSTRINRDDNIIVAYMVNGNPLTDKDFPLKLVGSDLQKNEMIGGIASIILHLPGSTTEAPATPTAEPATPTAAPAASQPSDAALTINGKVEQEMSWTTADIQGMQTVKIQAKHPKTGDLTDYEGVRISDLLALVKPAADASKVVFTASDGYTAELDLVSLNTCTDCLISFNESGQLKTVMPDQISGLWVKDLIKIEIQ